MAVRFDSKPEQGVFDMSTVINTNIAALSAQRALTSTAGQLATSLQRLTSGLRINSAKDDAAGLAIVERLTTQVRGYQQAIRNAGDGISVAQTAEGGLDSVMLSLQRMRELAVQSANFTNTTEDRQAIQKEVDQMLAEIERVAGQTKFNGQALLDGTFNGSTFQVGANVGETIQIDGVLSAKTDKIGEISDKSGIAVAAAGGKTLTVGTTTHALTKTAVKDVVQEINALGVAGLYAYVDPSDSNKLGLAYSDPDPSNPSAVSFDDDGAGAGAAVLITAAANDKFAKTLNMENIAGANKAILSIDKAISEVSSSRARLGATINRFEQTISNLRITVENQTASRSRIQDADFAQETAAMTRAQILQQSGMSVLAQANSIPQNVLSLLRQ